MAATPFSHASSKRPSGGGPRAWAVLASLLFVVSGALYGAAAALDPVAISERNRDAVVVTLGERVRTGVPVQGSGSCVHRSGIVLTTAHQVRDLENLRIRLADGTELPARVAAMDPQLDFALIYTDSPIPAAVEIGDARTLRMGSPLLAITSPRGLEFSAVSGIVSSMNRRYRGNRVIQTDLPASPGSSGGPVFDERGRLVGLVAQRVEEVQGATLVTPINAAYTLLKQHGVPLPQAAGARSAPGEIIPAADITADDRAAVRAYNRGVNAATPEAKMEAYAKAVGSLPEFFEAWFNLGVARTAASLGPEAIEAYTAARALRPGSVAVHRNLGRLFLQYERVGEAAGAFGDALRLNPGDASCHNDLGEAFRQLGEYDKAESAFREALRLRPEYAAAHYNLGLTYASSGRAPEAMERFEAYLRLNPGASDAAQVAAWIEELGTTK